MDEQDWVRAATAEDLQRVIRALNEAGAEYLLIGSYALAVHGFERSPTDIHLLAPATCHSGERVRQALQGLLGAVAADIDPEWFEEGEPIRLTDAFVVDILFKVCGETYQSLLPYAQTKALADGTPVLTLSLAGLLKTKQGARPKDKKDRLLIEAALRGGDA